MTDFDMTPPKSDLELDGGAYGGAGFSEAPEEFLRQSEVEEALERKENFVRSDVLYGNLQGYAYRSGDKGLGYYKEEEKPEEEGQNVRSDGNDEGEDPELLVFDDSSPHTFREVLEVDIAEFMKSASPSREEEDEVRLAVEKLRETANAVFGSEASTVLFGSRATGLALPGGDLDVGILNIFDDIRNAGAGFTRKDRDKIASMLKKLLNKLRKRKVINRAQLINARVPIIKGLIGKTDLDCDISIGVSNGDRAVQLVKDYIAKLPHFRTLVLLVKAILKCHNLNEVYLGGLGSYSLYNMVIAHLLVEQETASEGDRESIGHLLVSFLKRFGEDFDYVKEAVSINQGGFIKKTPSWIDRDKPFLLAIEDPQEPGRDIGKSSHNISAVKSKFQWCYDVLRNFNMKDANIEKRFSVLGKIMQVAHAFIRSAPGKAVPNRGNAAAKQGRNNRKAKRNELQGGRQQAGNKRKRQVILVEELSESPPRRTRAVRPKKKVEPKQIWFKKSKAGFPSSDEDEEEPSFVQKRKTKREKMLDRRAARRQAKKVTKKVAKKVTKKRKKGKKARKLEE